MNVSVFGLGYVGCVSAACLAQDGHNVIGVDVDPRKVATISAGRAPFFEPGLELMLNEAVLKGTLYATTEERDAIERSDMAMVCVGTPSRRTGEIRVDALRSVLTSIGQCLRDRVTPFVLILRSTVMPNIVEQELIPLLERSAGKSLGHLLQFCYNPEFLREGTAIRDFYEAPMIVIGHNDSWAAEFVAELYSKVDAPIVYTDIGTACTVKYACNAYHALKVSFANEVGQLSEQLKVNGRRVMEIVCMDRKLNISSMYMKPGFAFGGSCLPKDLRALTAETRTLGLSLPLLHSILPSNRAHLQTCIETILDTGVRSLGLLGLAFKEGTDDLRESPAIELAEALIGKGINLTIYEPAISSQTIYGSNLGYLENNIPHIWSLLTTSLSELLNHHLIVLLRTISDDEREALRSLSAEHICIDLANALGSERLHARTLLSGARSSELAAI